MTMFETLEEMQEFMQESIKNIGANFTTEDDDWMQIALLETPNGMDVVPLDGALFDSAHTKDALAFVLRKLMVTQGVVRYGVLMNAFMIRKNREEDADLIEAVRREEMLVSDIPGRTETLILTLGDAETEYSLLAPINFTDKGVRTLGEWEKTPMDSGRFVNLNSEMGRIA
jgi:hypothetical protein